MPVEQTFSVIVGEFQKTLWPETVQYLITFSPVILMLILLGIFADLWVRYVRAKFYNSLKYAVLELRLPKDNFKSPLAMETFFQSIHNTSDGSPYAQYWKGEYRPYYSVELISIEGQVKFMIWCEDRRKGGVMSSLYSQYPGIEIVEREDYSRSVHYDPKTMKIWAAEFEFTQKDGDPYPIKTYVDYGLDKDPKEEMKVDPLVPVLEFLGSVGPNQQVWMQIIIQAHKKDQSKPGSFFKKYDLYDERAKELVNEILMRDPKTKVAGEVNEETGLAKKPTISRGEEETVAAIERNMGKAAFDTCIRAIYIAKRDIFHTQFGIGGIISSFKQFSTQHWNGFKPNGKKWIAQFSGTPWEDYKEMRRTYYSKEVLKAYRRRGFIHGPYKTKPLILSTEELATMFHIPGAVAATPGLTRVPSKKAEAPVNLPV